MCTKISIIRDEEGKSDNVNNMNKMMIFGGAAIVLVGAVVSSSLLFMNPTASVGATNVGFRTESQIKSALEEKLAATQVQVATVDGQTVDTTFSDLGVTVDDLDRVSQEAFSSQVLWKVGNWGRSATPVMDVVVDEGKLKSFTDSLKLPVATPAEVKWENAAWAVTPEVEGYVVDRDVLKTSVQKVITEGVSTVEVPMIKDTSTVTTADAQKLADELNTFQANLVFQVGAEQVKAPLEAPVFSVTNENNTLVSAPDPEGVEALAGVLPGLVNRDAKPRKTITDTQGQVLAVNEDGYAGRKLKDDKPKLVDAITAAVQNREPTVNVNVEEIPVSDIAVTRRIDVNLTEQKTTLYENEQVVKQYTISSGKAGNETGTGNFRVRAFVRMQDMGGAGYGYLTPDVPWVVYFNGDEAFHGTYWHNNFGTPMSHGCVNMRINEAEELYRFAYEGMEVSVHY